MSKNSKLLFNGIITENPIFVQLLGMCPTLAVTTSLKNGIGMGLSATAVLIASEQSFSRRQYQIPLQCPESHFGMLLYVRCAFSLRSCPEAASNMRSHPSSSSFGIS